MKDILGTKRRYLHNNKSDNLVLTDLGLVFSWVFVMHQHSTRHIVPKILVNYSVNYMENNDHNYETCWYDCDVLIHLVTFLRHVNVTVALSPVETGMTTRDCSRVAVLF